MSEKIRVLLKELKNELVKVYGNRLKGLYLYGSYARGGADQESDLDVLIVLDDFEKYGLEVDRTGLLGSELSLKHRISISQVFIREQEWIKGDSPFLLNVRQEAIAA